MFIDTHAHLNFKAFKGDYKTVIKRAFDTNVKSIINVGSNYKTSEESIKIAESVNSGVWAAVGLHPIHLVKDVVESSIFDGKEYSFKTKQEVFNYDKYKKLAESSDKVVAIGETGIDLFRLEDDKHSIKDIIKLQSDVFRQHIKLAKELDLPLIIHSRDEHDPSTPLGAGKKFSAYDLMLDILKEEFLRHPERSEGSKIDSSATLQNDKHDVQNHNIKGVVHCFVGNIEQAKKYIDLGFYIGFTGIITFKNAKEVQEVAKNIDLDKILIETDCPFLAPVPYRGKSNEPAYVIEVAKKITEIKNIPLEQVKEQTTENAIKLFSLK